LTKSKWEREKINIKDIKYPILTTKLYIPQPRPDLVQRTHLIDRLDKGINHKLTLISAPAGFGKTTLISEWISRSEIPVAWISLDKGDNDPVQFIHYLIAALQSFDASIGQSALTMLQSPQKPPIESILTNLIKEITDISYDFILVLDDYHSLDEKQVHNIVEFLLDHLPAQMHLVITTRVDPPLPLARLRVRNQLTEFRASDLCFSLDEATDFFNKLMNLELSSHEISILESRTEGWVAGLQLAALTMQRSKDIPAFVKTFAGDDRHIVDYLVEEVLNLQPEHVQNFLLQTSILNRLSEPLCDFVTGKKGSQKILDELEKANLFIVPLDNKRYWYRYHHLFADLLRQRLHQTQSELIPELHSRASKWYEKNNFKDKAVDYALVAGDFKRAAHLIGKFVEVAWEYGGKTRLLKWFKILPDEFICKEPNLCFFHAWVLFENGQHNAAEESLQVVERLINSIIETPSKESDGLRPFDKVELQGKVAAIRAGMATSRGDVQDIIKFSRQALECLPEGDSTWRASVTISSGIAHSIKGDLIAAIDAFSQAIIVSNAAGNLHLYLVASFWLIARLKYAGKFQRAIEICRELLDFVKEKGLTQTLVGGGLFVIWGELCYELNELDEALRYVEKGLALVEQGHDVGHLGWSYLSPNREVISASL
jgi:LuxR family maltose regulon positive regulatory protein